MVKNTSPSTAWGDVRSSPKQAPKQREVRDSKTMNVGYGGQRQSPIPVLTLDVRQDLPLYKQGNDEYINRPVAPNYLDSNQNDNG